MHDTQLKSVAEIFNGLTPSKGEQRDTGFPVLKIKDVSENGDFLRRFSSFVDDDYTKGFEDKIIRAGDILILNAAHNADYVGSKHHFVRYGSYKSLATGEWLIIRPNEKVVEPMYINYWVQHSTIKKQIRDLVKGIHLYPKDIGNLLIQLPSEKNEQKRIAAILDKADRLRRQRRFAQTLSDSFLQSVFVQMFDFDKYTVSSLSDLASKNKGSFVNGPFGSDLLTTELTDKGVPVIYVRDIKESGYKRISTVCVTEEKAKQLDICSVQPSDVLVAKVGDPPGIAAVYPNNQPKAIVTQDVIRIKPNFSKIAPEFLSAYLNSSRGKHELKKITIEGTRERFSLTQYKQLEIPIPPLPLQEKFAAVVQKFERIRRQQREATRQAEHLFQTLLHRAFRGEL